MLYIILTYQQEYKQKNEVLGIINFPVSVRYSRPLHIIR